MTVARDIAAFVARSSYDDLSRAAREALEIRVLDSLGCAFGALGAEPIALARRVEEELGGAPCCSLIGGGRTAPDRAAFLNGAMVRYLDFNDAYLALGETCHPSDNLAPVLAAAEYARADGRTLLTALAVAYQVHCRLSDEAPVRYLGFDHTTQGAVAVAAGVARALDLDVERISNALAIAATISPALRVTRTGPLSHWKGLAYPHAAFAATHAAFLARSGVTGPPEAFEGNKGFMDLTGPFTIDWSSEDLERVTQTAVKRFNAEVHAQSAVEAALELVAEHDRVRALRRVEVDVFDVAHRIIGGGEEGDKTVVRTKEQADHSLPYMIAAALLDGRLMPDQYTAERIARADVQELLLRVVVRPDPSLTARFPKEHPCRVRLLFEDGTTLEKEKSDYLGFPTRPMPLKGARAKFDLVARPHLEPEQRARVIDAVSRLPEIEVARFAESLVRDNSPP